MQSFDALTLIRDYKPDQLSPQKWADLGCGSGLFTKALAHLLPRDSIIYAVDKSFSSMNQLPDSHFDINIEKIQLDFINDDLPFTDLDGVLMANSLHYVKNKLLFIRKSIFHMKQQHSFLIVEYNTDTSNRWVPYPVSFTSLRELFENAGYTTIKKLREHSSIYNRGGMYSALIKAGTY